MAERVQDRREAPKAIKFGRILPETASALTTSMA